MPAPVPTLLHGVDLVEVARIAKMREEHPDRFLDRCFTPAEIEYARGSSRRLDEHLAARFAAKEAVVKALGTGINHGVAWTDIEVTRDAEGRPGVRLSGEAARRAEAMGVVSWAISLSHTGGMAMASVIGVVQESGESGR